jgi:hypothetical protein
MDKIDEPANDVNMFKSSPPRRSVPTKLADGLPTSKKTTKAVVVTPDKKKVEKAMFDLDLPDIPDEVVEIDDHDVAPPVAPIYRRTRLLAFTQAALVKAGVLVQVYNYKKVKELPLRGGKQLTVEKGEPVTFYKVAGRCKSDL